MRAWKRRAAGWLAALALLWCGAGPAAADHIYDASGTFTDVNDHTTKYTLTGTVTFNDMGGLVSTDLQVLSGTTALIDTGTGNPVMAISQQTDAGGTVYDELHSTFPSTHLTLFFLPGGIGGGGPVALVPSITVTGGVVFTSNFRTFPPATAAEGNLDAGGVLTPEAPTSTPEPASITLLGVGAFTVGGLGLLRRRRGEARSCRAG
jgi:hypothetical protein